MIRRLGPWFFVLCLLALCTLADPAGAQGGRRGQGIGELWENNCLRCHGDRGQGGGSGASSLLDGQYRFGGKDRELFNSIKSGHPEEGMEAFANTLSDPQIWSLVVYIRELQSRDERRRGVGPKPDAAGVYDSQHHQYRVRPVLEDLSLPWAVDFFPAGESAGPGAGEMILTERGGRVSVVRGGKPEPIEGTPAVFASGQGGMLEVAIHPDFAVPDAPGRGWIYLAFSDPSPDRRRSMTRLVRGKLQGQGQGQGQGQAWRWTDQQDIWQANPEHYLSGGLHFGTRIVFGPLQTDGPGKGKRPLWFAIGERGRDADAQNLALPNGKIHRVFDDGQVPADNPFVGRDDAYASIWSFGHRNPQGLVMDPAGNLWDTEHGPRGGDELNLVVRGRNYGWPVVSFGIQYSGMPFRTPWADTAGPQAEALDIAMPVYVWTPSIGACGLDVARGAAFPEWEGDLLAGGLSGTNVDRLRVRKDQDGNWRLAERETLVLGIGRVRDVVTGPDGTIYVVLNDPDSVVRLMPAQSP